MGGECCFIFVAIHTRVQAVLTLKQRFSRVCRVFISAAVLNAKDRQQFAGELIRAHPTITGFKR
jgi:hypothetical protein